MKKYIITLLFCTLFCHLGIAQGLKSVSILGDSYSTFEGYVQPDTNFVWYLKTPPEGRKTDMVSVRNTWWHQFIKENNYRLCVNNSFSGATICHTGYRSEDYSDRSFITRMKSLGCPDIIFIFGATNDYWAKNKNNIRTTQRLHPGDERTVAIILRTVTGMANSSAGKRIIHTKTVVVL